MKLSAIVWSWSNALLCSIAVLPAVIIAANGNLKVGLALTIGVLPSAIIGLQPTRKKRIASPVVGTLLGLSIILGSWLTQWEVVAVVGLFLLAVVAAKLASRWVIGLLATNLILPLVAIGFSYPDIKDAASFAAAILASSLFAYLVSLAWPQFKPLKTRTRQLLTTRQAQTYGIQLGLAGATAAAIGFALNFEHVGWAAGAALLVMRPEEDAQKLRSIGRLVSVAIGAIAACLLLSQTTSPLIISICAGIAIVVAGATAASRWYMTATFTTFIVFLLLLNSNPASAAVESRFDERVLETILGVTLAYLFGIFMPQIHSIIKNKFAGR